ncbi:MAG: transposase [Myxococcota bacterium]|nr:transposase [Myxococcota bacterium]
MGSPAPLQVTVPIETEVVVRNRGAVTGAQFVAGKGLAIDLDVRRLNWRRKLRLSKGTKVHWENARGIEVQELSSFLMPVWYRVTFGDGWYEDRRTGQRVYFGVGERLPGIDLQRGVTATVLRAGVLLAVMSGVGLRAVCWLLQVLFHVEVSKSSLARWVEECAAKLPDAAGMVRRLLADRPVTEGHFDEIFPRGWKQGCVLVLRDEHGRIVAAQQIPERTPQHVVAFLKKLKEWGLRVRAFYVDGYKVYRDAIRQVYPEAHVQLDYFHVLQNIWRKLWRAAVAHRKEIKRRGEQASTPWYSRKLEALAKRLWENRGLLFKSADRMTPEEVQRLAELIEDDRFVGTVRTFLERVWGIFRDSRGELGARQRLGRLKQRPEVRADPQGPFAKSVDSLDDRFDDMTTFLRHPGVRRNSLAETGIRVLRRLEQGHDGFRGDQGRDNYLRLYQAIKYCGWQVYRRDGLLNLPPGAALAA